MHVQPAGAGKVLFTNGGAVVNPGDTLKKDDILVVTATPNSGYKHKKTTAVGATNTTGNKWEVYVESGQVTFTVEFEKAITLGATTILPSGTGSATITRKDGTEVKQGDELTKGDTLVVTTTHNDGYKLKEVKAVGAGNEWKVIAKPGEKVIFTVTFEKKPEGEGGNSNEPTPVESVLLAQARLFPNPTGGLVTVNAGSAIARCEVYSSTGVLLQAIESPESVFTIDLMRLLHAQ